MLRRRAEGHIEDAADDKLPGPRQDCEYPRGLRGNTEDQPEKSNADVFLKFHKIEARIGSI